MTKPSLASQVFQIGYVVPDLTAAMAFFKEKLGVPRFLEIRNANLSDKTFRGKPSDMRYSMAFGYLGDMQIELIEPVSGDSTYSEFLKRNPTGGAQHVAFMVEDFDAACADLKAKGFDIVQSGRNGKTRLAYFDTEAAIGTLTELVYIDPPERAHFAELKEDKA